MKQKFYAKSVSIAEETDKIKEVAEKLGIVLPSTHTALFQSVYAPIEESNLNGVRLAEDAVERALPGLIASQCNMEHMGYGWIVGIILSAWINDKNEIEIVYSFAKNIYENEYVLALEAMANNELAVSFELLAETDKQERLPDGTVLLHEIDFQGVGMLIDNPPAYPKAKTYEYAKAIKHRVKDSINRDLVFASKIEEKCDEILNADKWTSDIWNNFPNSSFAVVEPAFLDGTCGDYEARHLAFKDRDGKFDLTNYCIALDKVNKILPVTDSITTEELREVAKEELDKYTDMVVQAKNEDKLNQGGNTHMELTEEQKAKVEEIRAEFGDFAKDIADEDLLDDSVIAELRAEKESKEAEETTEETTEEEASEEQATEEEASEETSESEEETTEEASEETTEEATEETEEEKQAKELAYKLDSVEIRTFSVEEEDGVEVVVENMQRMTVTDYNAMAEAQEKVTELESTLEAKNSEIETIRENATKIAETKAQLKDNEFTKDFSDEDYLNEEKVAEAIQSQENAKVIAERKEELKDNDYAKDFSDEDLLNDDKVELARVKKEKDELKAKVPTEEIQASEETPEPEMDTGDAEAESTSKEIMASIRKENTETRDSQKVYERQE